MPGSRRYGIVAGLVFFGLLFLPATSGAAAKPASAAKSAEQLYAETTRDWKKLLRDESSAGKRDPWLAIEKRFLAVAGRDPKGDAGAKGQYQAARSREELAKRSYLASDWQNAVELYRALARQYPRHNLADDGLYQAADISARRLGKADDARNFAQTLITAYPKGDMADDAAKLLASLPRPAAKAAGRNGAQNAAPQPAQSARGGGGTAVQPQAAPLPRETRASTLGAVIARGTVKSSTVLLELDGAASFRHQYLGPTGKNPARLVVDIDGVAAGANVKPNQTFSGMAVSRARAVPIGAGDKKGLRVIIELRNVRHYVVESGVNPPGIHVRCSVAADLPGGASPPEDGRNGAVVEGRHAASASGRPGTLVEQLGLTVRTIMIDAGHGGKDPGAMGNDITESAVTLSLARMLEERLKKQGLTVLTAREKNVYVPLDQRTVIANTAKADLFISLHVNSSNDKNTHGLETYFLDLARSSSAAKVAARENAVSVKSISDLQFILTDLMLTSKLQESQDLAAAIHQKMLARLTQAGFSVGDNGVRSAPFYVLMGARMPAVLVEIGYLSHTGDARRIKSEKYLERLADGITLGVMEYKNKLGRFTPR
ncbi:MAG: N-acetylmuramoyl-L-alanine amidase [Deltaproteobacteria bacterium]|jgi:N-acetylmuramoyl-L-alanine amidase|nr:N-acetylmuramoyl-L-alanine amidase [Deltaproteobacteria bacterium]